MEKLDSFINRLSKIGIKIKLVSNYPWIYINTINGKLVMEKFQGNHGFTVAFTTPDGILFNDISKIFKLIRKYTKK